MYLGARVMRNVTLLVLCVAFAGCRPEAPPSVSSNNANPAMEAADAAEQSPKTLKINCTPLTAGLMRRWADSFQAIHSDAEIEVTTDDYLAGVIGMASDEDFAFCGESSGDGFVVINPRSGPCSWPVVVAIDELTIIVHHENPIRELTVDQVAWIYSEQGQSWTASIRPEWYKRFDVAEYVNSAANPQVSVQRKEPPAEDAVLDHPRIDDWRELGCYDVPGDGAIHAFGRDNADWAFLEVRTIGYPVYLFGDGMFFPRHPRNDDAIEDLQDPDAMVAAVAADPQAIGYVSHSRIKPGVRGVPVQGEVRANNFGPPPTEIDPEQEPYRFDLPVLERPIYLWIRPSYAGERPPLAKEFLQFILSRQGQSEVVRAGFFPTPAYVADRQWKAALNTPQSPPQKDLWGDDLTP